MLALSPPLDRFSLTPGIIFGHELGHVWARWTDNFAEGNIADNFENMVRTLKNPNANIRTKHEPDRDIP